MGTADGGMMTMRGVVCVGEGSETCAEVTYGSCATPRKPTCQPWTQTYHPRRVKVTSPHRGLDSTSVYEVW